MTNISNERALIGSEKQSEIRKGFVVSEEQIVAPLSLVTGPQRANDALELFALMGTLPIIQNIRQELSQFVRSAKAALLNEEKIGFAQYGFEPLSIRSLVDKVEFSLEISDAITRDRRAPGQEKMAALELNSLLEKLHLELIGYDYDSLMRKDVKSLLPMIQEFKQVFMAFELKISLGNSKAVKE
jgi:hypothetical protein